MSIVQRLRGVVGDLTTAIESLDTVEIDGIHHALCTLTLVAVSNLLAVYSRMTEIVHQVLPAATGTRITDRLIDDASIRLSGFMVGYGCISIDMQSRRGREHCLLDRERTVASV